MKEKEERIRIAYCGTAGSFSESAARRIFPQGALSPSPTFREAYEKTVRGETDYTVIPIENSYAGEVTVTADLLYRGNLFVREVYDMRIVQCLVGLPGAKTKDIRRVISHPQALAQCADYIAEHRLEEISSENTAFAAKAVAEGDSRDTAAIAGRECAAIYGLKILEEDIAGSEENATRFAVLGVCPPARKTGDHVILLFSVNDRSGALADALKIIADHGYNMKALHSRPLKDKPWQYYFYIEAEGSEKDDALLEDLKDCSADAKIAGRFLPARNI